MGMQEGRCIVIDDSFEHELASSPADQKRTILEVCSTLLCPCATRIVLLFALMRT